EAAPEGPILGVRTPDVGVKEALISDAPDVFFTTPHFDGYPAVLVDLDAASVEDLEEVILEAWAAQAPKRLSREYLAERGLDETHPCSGAAPARRFGDMFAETTSVTMVGAEPRPVRVEAHVGGAKDVFKLSGLPDTAVREAKDRVRAAGASSSMSLPARHVTVNLAPADLPKGGADYDLPIALCVLGAAGTIPAQPIVALGELALDGTVRAGRGSLGAAIVASRMGVPCLVADEAAAEASSVAG